MAYAIHRTLKSYNMSKNSESVKKHRQKKRKFIRDEKQKPCMDCGVQYPYYVMQFDHVRGEKKFNFSSAHVDFRNFDSIVEEMLKCDVVCANCHAIRTYSRLVFKVKTLDC